jgi:hypothetical protein
VGEAGRSGARFWQGQRAFDPTMHPARPACRRRLPVAEATHLAPRRRPGGRGATVPRDGRTRLVTPQSARRRPRPPSVPAHHAGRDARARLGRARRLAHQRRRVRRSPCVRRGPHRPLPRGSGLSGGHHQSAALGSTRRRAPHGGAAPLRGHHRGQPRLDAQQADRAEEDAVRRSVLAGRCRGHAPQPGDHRVREPGARGDARGAHRDRRHRGLASAHRPLRLLVRLGAALGAARQQGGPHHLRDG